MYKGAGEVDMDSNLTVYVRESILQGAKRYAEQHGTTLERLIAVYLYHLAQQSAEMRDAPIVQRLSGSLSADISKRDYHEYLQGKYGPR
jgi:hypothetical protein